MDLAGFNYNTYLVCFLLGALISLLLTPLVIRLAFYWGVVEKPDYRKVHSKLMPLLGGVAVFAGMWLPMFLLLFWNNKITIALAEHWHTITCIFLGASVMLTLGIIDDKYGISPIKKLLVETVAAVSLVAAGIGFSHITVPFYGKLFLGSFGPPLTILWIVGITNAINLIDGIDGLATGVTFFIASVTAVIAIINANFLMALMMCSLAGAAVGFLRYNFSPARVFLGDTGSLFIGMTLATTAISSNFKGHVAASMLVPVLLLGLPIIDTFLAMVRRTMYGKSMFSPDRNHIHHRLVAMGFSQRKAVLLLYGFCLLFCSVALLTVLQNKVVMGLGIVGLTVVAGFGAKCLGYQDVFLSKKMSEERPVFRMAQLITDMAKVKITMAQTEEDIWDVLRNTCEGFEMEYVKITFQNSSKNDRITNRFDCKRKKSGFFTVNGNNRRKENKVLDAVINDSDIRVEFFYAHPVVSKELEAEIPRLMFIVLNSVGSKIRALRS